MKKVAKGMYTAISRPLLFRMDPEKAHHGTVNLCRWAGRLPLTARLARACWEVRAPELEVKVAGITFANPVGLAAGWDKSGHALPFVAHMGFGHVEIGSVSARPSIGNPKPRLFRLPQDEAIVVYYGLPNDGAQAVAARLQGVTMPCPLGINIVKTNDGPDAPPAHTDEILNDYAESVRQLDACADYLTLNLSCPNAKGGKHFFVEEGHVRLLLERLAVLPVRSPVILKVAPFAGTAEIDQLLAQTEPFPFVKGFMINLPAGKPSTLTTPRTVWENWPGAVAGRPAATVLKSSLLELARRMPHGRYQLIGGGGVFTAEEAYARIRLGASLVQVYTALIYQGPGTVRRINEGLLRLLQRDGFAEVGEAVGVDL